MGALLGSPRAALARIEAEGGGLRDALVLVLLGVVCFRLDGLARAVMGLSHLSGKAVVGNLVGAAAGEVNLAVLAIIPAAVLITFFAGRGHRDPTLDLELGAACFTPFFAVRAGWAVATALGVPTRPYDTWAYALGAAWEIRALVAAVAVARRRIVAPPGRPAVPRPAPALPRRPAAAAAAALGAVMAATLVLHGTWVAHNVDALRPFVKGQAAPDFTLPRLGRSGETITLSALRGQAVLLDFWATWCTPCLQMMPLLHKLHETWQGRGVAFLGVNSENDQSTRDEVEGFLRRRPLPYPTLFDDGSVMRKYRVTALPHLVLLDADGTVRKEFWGTTTKGELEEAFRTVARPLP